jgi:hypothetical protein
MYSLIKSVMLKALDKNYKDGEKFMVYKFMNFKMIVINQI